MAVLKCENCGGSLNIREGVSVCECEYCGTKQTVPTTEVKNTNEIKPEFYQNVLDRAVQKQTKKGVSYPEKDGNLYNVLKVFYIIGFGFATVMNFMYILGMLIVLSDNSASSNNVGSVISVAVCTVLMIAALIASKHNANAIVASVFGGVNLGVAIIAIVTFMRLMSDDTVVGGINLNFYWRHLAPLGIMAFCAVGMALIVIIAHFKTKEAYNDVLESIYYEYSKLPNDDKPNWDEYVKNYKFGKK